MNLDQCKSEINDFQNNNCNNLKKCKQFLPSDCENNISKNGFNKNLAENGQNLIEKGPNLSQKMTNENDHLDFLLTNSQIDNETNANYENDAPVLCTTGQMSPLECDFKTMDSRKSVSSCGTSALEVARNLVGSDESDEDDEENDLLTGNSALVQSGKKSILLTTNPNDNLELDRNEEGYEGYSRNIDSEEAEEDEDSSSLGSSTSCSEASFELGSVETFEIEHHLNINRQKNTKNSPLDNIFSNFSSFSNQKLIEESGETEIFNHDCAPKSIFGNLPSALNCIKIIKNEIVEEDSRKNLVEKNRVKFSNDVLTSVDSRTNLHNCENHNLSKTSPKIQTNTKTAHLIKNPRVAHIDEELSKLDTFLPKFDFEKLEQQLTDAVKEREMSQRQLMSEEVRKRLALDYCDSETENENCDNNTVPQNNLHNKFLRSSRQKLKQNMNLQICFVNDGLPSEDDDEDDDDDSGHGVPKSFSTPNLRTQSTKNEVACLGRSISNGGDSEKRASELRKAVLEQQQLEDKDFEKRRTRLECETKLMLAKAKQAARMQMELEKQSVLKRSKSAIEEIIGLSIGKRKLSRTQLSKMCITQLLIIINDLHSRIQTHNEELVHLLIERDSLHMEQDSMLVDIEDLLQHQKSGDVKLPDFLTSSIEKNNNTIIKNGHCKQISRFRIFKR